MSKLNNFSIFKLITTKRVPKNLIKQILFSLSVFAVKVKIKIALKKKNKNPKTSKLDKTFPGPVFKAFLYIYG